MRKLFVILFVIVIVTLLATSCSFPFGPASAQKDTDVLSGNDVTLADVTVNVDSRDFSTTEFRTCNSAVQVESNSCGITIEAAP